MTCISVYRFIFIPLKPKGTNIVFIHVKYYRIINQYDHQNKASLNERKKLKQQRIARCCSLLLLIKNTIVYFLWWDRWDMWDRWDFPPCF